VRTPTRRIDVTGADRVRYLEDVTTQHLVDVPVTHVRGALVLDAHGAPTAMFDVVVLGDRLVLLAPGDDVVATILDVLATRTFLLDVTFTPSDHVVAAVRGDDAAAVVGRAGLTVIDGRCRLAGDVLVVSRPGGGIDVVGPAGAIDAAIASLVDAGATTGGPEDLDAWRIPAGVPTWGVEVAAPHLPEELGLLPSHVHLAKGCYPGQEAVARMWMLGRPRRRLAVVAPVDGPLAPGVELGSGRRRVTVTAVTPDGPGPSRSCRATPRSAATSPRPTAVRPVVRPRRRSRSSPSSGPTRPRRGTIRRCAGGGTGRGAEVRRQAGAARSWIAARTWSACCFGWTFGHTAATVPSGAISTVERSTPSYSLPYIVLVPHAP
jgi:tRNA-modifying protein YgfZ